MFVTTTEIVAGAPAVMIGSVTPSSSSLAVISSPVAATLVVAAYSVSTRAPIRSSVLAVLLALMKPLKSSKSVVGAAILTM